MKTNNTKRTGATVSIIAIIKDKNTKQKNKPKMAKRKKMKLSSIGVSGTGKSYKSAKETKMVQVGKKGKGHSYSVDRAKLKNALLIDDCTKLAEREIRKATKPKQKKQDLHIGTKRIQAFLKSLNNIELIYLNNNTSLSSSMRTIVRDYNLSKERFCTEMDIKKSQYKDYMCGGKEYDLMDMAKLNALSVKLINENTESQVPVQFPKSGAKKK